MDDRTPPHDLDAEKSALGGAMLTKQALFDVLEAVKGNDFYIPKHELILDAIASLALGGQPVDPISVADELSRSGEISRAGGAEYLHHLTGFVPTSANAGYYAEIVKDKAGFRRLLEAGMRIQQMAYASEGTSVELLNSALAELDRAVGKSRPSVRMVKDILPTLIQRLESKATFIPTPWPTLNEAIGGLRPGEVYVIAARPGVGKSVVATQIAAHVSKLGFVAFSSLEMSSEELVARIVSERLGVNIGNLKNNRLTAHDWELLASRRTEITELNLAIDDRVLVSGIEVRAHARAVSQQGELALVVVDYMQLMSSTSKADRQQQVSEFSRQMKIMAKEMHVPVVALSQLNRDVESRMDRTPRLSDLRESGSIEQDASVVILLRREGQFPSEHLILDVAKNRHGETGLVDLAWQGSLSRAVEWSN